MKQRFGRTPDRDYCKKRHTAQFNCAFCQHYETKLKYSNATCRHLRKNLNAHKRAGLSRIGKAEVTLK